MCVAAACVSAPVEFHVLDKNVHGRIHARVRTCTYVDVRARALCELGLKVLLKIYRFWYLHYSTSTLCVASWCRGRESDSRSRGRGFESRPVTINGVKTLGKFLTPMVSP